MRCSRRRGVILYKYFANGCFAAYTSPPPTAEPLLKEKPFGECTFQLSPIAVQRFRSYSTRPRGTPILIGAGLAKPDRRGNIQGDGWRLRRSGHANFPCHGGLFTGPAFQLNPIDFHVTTQPSLILSWAPRKNRSPSSLRPSLPSSLPIPRKKPLPMGGALLVALSLS